MKELVVISGKGGTGKTSVMSSFAAMSKRAVLADCDVDAADLHLILKPEVLSRNAFISGHEAVVRDDTCNGCGECLRNCRFDAVSIRKGDDGERDRFIIDTFSCEGCGVCVRFCPVGAIDFPDRHCGEWYVSKTRFGMMVHARLGIAAENSGKLVTLVREKAREIAERDRCDLMIVDGPPGVGCPVIASITGADAILAVTEPTLSGIHDLERVSELANHFKIPVFVCVNKYDINIEITDDIELKAKEVGSRVVGKIPYDREVTTAQIWGRSVVECGNGRAAVGIRDIWKNIVREI